MSFLGAFSEISDIYLVDGALKTQHPLLHLPGTKRPSWKPMEDPVVKAAQVAFAARLKEAAGVSEHTRNAQAIAKAWRGLVHQHDPDPGRFLMEALVTTALDQKIDIVDLTTACAYEFKVSGKNAPAEFYKDIVKVIMWNQNRPNKLRSLVFITEEKFGKPFLDAPMPRAYIKYLAQQGLDVRVEYVRHELALAAGSE
jgi:hypothetical protein